MLGTSARLLRLLSLLQTRRDWAGSALARRMEIDVRTVRRDVERLRTLGYQVAASAGKGGGYRLGGGQAMPPLLLSDDETVAVAMGLLTSALGGVSGLEEAALSAFTKLEQLVPAPLRGRIESLQRSTVALASGRATVDAQRLALLASACRDREQLKLDYQARDDARSTRLVEPHRLVCAGARWYLICWDTTRADWRTFRLDRIHRASRTGGRFIERSLPRPPSEFVSDSLGSAPYRYQAKVRFLGPASYVAERSSPSAGRLEPESERSCVLHTGSMSLDQLALHVAMKGIDFEIIEPPALAGHVRELGQRCLRAVAKGTRGRRRVRARSPKIVAPSE